MKELAASDFKSAFLGGQNHIALFVETALINSTVEVFLELSLECLVKTLVVDRNLAHVDLGSCFNEQLLSILSSRSPLTHNKGFVA